MQRLQNISSAECAVFLWRKVLPACMTLGHVGHMDVRDVVNSPLGFTNVISNVLRIFVLHGNDLI